MEDLAALSLRGVPTKWVGHPLVLRAETASTNDDAREAARAGAANGYTVVADSQHAGRGRQGRIWYSPPGRNLYVSVLLRRTMPALLAPVLALTAGLAVHDALSQMFSPGIVAIKWPNDVRLRGRKVAGVLVEGALRGESLGHAVIGVGINVCGVTLPDEVVEIATTVERELQRSLSRAAVLEALLVALEVRIEQLFASGSAVIAREVMERCDTIGRSVRVLGEEGKAVGVNDEGALLVQHADGSVKAVRAGEVELLSS